MDKNPVTWRELEIGRAYLNLAWSTPHYCIKVSNRMYFDLDDDKLRRHPRNCDIPNYIMCDYEVW